MTWDDHLNHLQRVQRIEHAELIAGNTFHVEFGNDSIAFIFLKQQEKTKKKDHFLIFDPLSYSSFKKIGAALSMSNPSY